MKDYSVRESAAKDRESSLKKNVSAWSIPYRRSENPSTISDGGSNFNLETIFKTRSGITSLFGDQIELEESVDKYNYVETNVILKPATVDEQIADRPWVKEIEKVDVSNDTWKCFTIFLLESEPSFYGIINFVNTALRSRERKAIRLINEEIIKKTALDHCFSSGERTPFATLCEAVKRAGGENFESKIPSDLLAYMIKYRMLQEREHYLKMKELEDKLKYRKRLRYVWLDQKYTKVKDEGKVGDALIDIKKHEGLFMKRQTKQKLVGNRKEFELLRMKRKLKKVMRKFSKVKQRYHKKKAKHRLKKKYTIQWKSYKRLWKAYRRYIKKCNRICIKLKRDIRKTGFKSTKRTKKGKSGKSKKKGGGQKERAKLPNVDIMEQEKLDTLLCRRGELGRHLYAVDDSPLNGPQIYFILSAFRAPDLPELLHELKVPINGYTFIGHVFAIPEAFCKELLTKDTFNDDVYRAYMKEYGHHFSLITACTISFQSEKKNVEPADVFETITEELDEFYKTFFKNLVDQKTYKHYENTIIKDFVPDLTKINFNSKSWIKKLVYQLYSDISDLAYHYYLISEVYKKYLRKLTCRDLTDSNPFSASHLQIYNTLLDKIPNEIIGVPLILDTIITQVCFNEGSFAGYRFENYLKYSENKLENLLTGKTDNYPCGNVLTEEEKNIKCLLFNDQIRIVTANCMNIREFVADRSDYILSLYFKYHWYINKTKLSDLEKKNYAHHYYLLLKAVNGLKIKDSRTFLDTLLSILSLEVKSDQEHWDVTDTSNILPDSPKIKGSSTDINVNNVGNDFNSIMAALIKLEQILKQKVQKVESSSSTEKESEASLQLQKLTFLDEISSKIVDDEIFGSLIKVTYFEELSKHVSLQVLWEAFDENNTIEKHYLPLIKKMIYICYNETVTELERAVLPTTMSLRDFARYGQLEMKDWYQANYKEVIQDDINETFSTTEFYELQKKKIKDNKLLSNNIKDQCLTLNECHLMLPLKYRLLLKDLQDTWVPYEFKSCKQLLQLYPTNSSQNINTEEELKLPILYNFDELYRTTLFTKTRQYVLCDSTIVTFKTYGQFYIEPKLLIQMRQNFHRFTYHTPLCVNKEPASILCSHFKGIKLVFYEIETSENKDLFPEKILPHDSEMNIKCDLEEDVLIIKDEVGEVEGEREKEMVEEQLPTIDDPLGNIPAKFECKLSLPNGLYLENIHLKDGTHYVKQKYLTKDFSINKFVEEEICRLYLNDGTVIKLLKKNVTEIYYACGRWVRMPKIEDGEEGEDEVASEAARVSKNLPQVRQSNVVRQSSVVRPSSVARPSSVVRPSSVARPSNVVRQSSVGRQSSVVRQSSVGRQSKKKRKSSKPLRPPRALSYQILEPDGKLYEFKNGQKFLIKEISVSEYVSTFRDARKICIQGGPLIINSGNNVQSVTFLDGTRISSETHIEEEEVFCDWSLSEIKLWFKTDEEVEEEEVEEIDDIDDETAGKYKKIDLSEDGFLWVSLSHMIEHPDFVTLVTYPFQPQKMALMLPNDITLVRFGNGCFDLEIEDNTILLLRHNQIVLDKIENSQLIQRACINFQVFKKINETPQLIFNCRNLSGDWLRADTTGCIQHTTLDLVGQGKFGYSEKQIKQQFEQCSTPSYLKNNTRRLVFDKHFTGYELFLTTNMTDFQLAVDCGNCAILKSFEEDPFIGHIYLLPVISYNQKWKINYCNIDYSLFKLPSTYGTDWLFPFYITRCVTCKEPELFIARFINEFIFKNMYQVLRDIMQEYVCRLLTELDIFKCGDTEKKEESILGEYDCIYDGMYPYLYLPFRQRDRPKSRIGKEATRLRRNLRKSAEAKLIFESPLLRKGKKRYIKCRSLNEMPNVFNYEYFRYMCGIMYREEFGPYFESPSGIAFRIIDTVITRVLIFSDLKNLKENMAELFEKPMEELTAEDLDTMEIFLDMFYYNIWGPTEKKIDINQVLQAAKRLGDFFPNMRHALNFNVNSRGKDTIEELVDSKSEGKKKCEKTIKCDLNTYFKKMATFQEKIKEVLPSSSQTALDDLRTKFSEQVNVLES